MKRLLTFMLLGVSFSSPSSAEQKCTAPTSYKDLIMCAEIRSLEVQNAQFEVDRSKLTVEAAGQWRNPELSAETFQGKVNGEQREETDLFLAIPLEIGGKISARKDLARGGLSLAEAQLNEVRYKLRSQVYLKLHRLRQLIHEQEIADEAIGTFSKLIKQFASRPGLSPEQKISYSVYQLSKSEYELKKSGLMEDLYGLDAFFQLHLGISTEQAKKVLPKSPDTWPKIMPPENSTQSPQQLAFQADLETAKAQLSLAQSEAWPTLMIGPSMKIQKEAGQSNNLMGVNISLPLPVFNLNGRAKEAAAAGVKLNEGRRDLALQTQNLRRQELQKIYEQAVQTMSISLSHDDIEKRHRDSDKLISRGVVPSSLVIEAHRTSFELERTRHERELRALEAFIEIQAIDGKIWETTL